MLQKVWHYYSCSSLSNKYWRKYLPIKMKTCKNFQHMILNSILKSSNLHFLLFSFWSSYGGSNFMKIQFVHKIFQKKIISSTQELGQNYFFWTQCVIWPIWYLKNDQKTYILVKWAKQEQFLHPWGGPDTHRNTHQGEPSGKQQTTYAHFISSYCS